MKKLLFGLIGLALLGGQPLPAGALPCGHEKACSDCGDCCPHCGCRLVRVCHTYCTTKTVIEYKYTCVCEEKCVPGLTPLCDRCGSCDNCCEEGCGRCRVHDVHKLVKCPVFKEVPVRKCTVEWVCPNCSNSAEPGPTSAPPAAPGTPTLVVPPPPPPKTPDAAPMPPPAIGPHKAP